MVLYKKSLKNDVIVKLILDLTLQLNILYESTVKIKINK